MINVCYYSALFVGPPHDNRFSAGQRCDVAIGWTWSFHVGRVVVWGLCSDGSCDIGESSSYVNNETEHQRSHSQSATGRQTNSVCVVSADSSAAFWRWENAKRGFSFCVTKAVPPIEHSHWESCWNKGKIVAYCQFKANTAAALWSCFFLWRCFNQYEEINVVFTPRAHCCMSFSIFNVQMLALGCCCCCCCWW